MNVQQAIADFLQHGQAVRNLSDRTLRAYHSDLSQFHLHVNDTNMVDITPERLEEYLEKLGTGPYRDTSIRRKVAALKVFFRYLEESGVVSESPARKLRIKRPVENRIPTVLSGREIRSLLAAPKEQITELALVRDHSPGGRNRYFCAIRDNLILELLFSTGIRIGELVAMNVADVNFDAREIHITGRATRGRSRRARPDNFLWARKRKEAARRLLPLGRAQACRGPARHTNAPRKARRVRLQ